MMQENRSSTYKSPFLLALAVHVLVIVFLVFELTFPTRSSSPSGGSVIQAVAVSQSVLDRYQQQKEQEVLQKIQQQLALQRQQALQKQMQIEKEQAIQKQIALQKLQAEKAQKLAQEKAQAIKMAEQKAAEKAQERQVKAAKQAELKKILQQQLKSDIQKQIASSGMPARASANKANKSDTPSANTAQNMGEIDKYKALIIQSISQQWIVPANIEKNISCELDVHVAPGGVVLDVTVTRSSGNPALDNSAMAAVKKASPLPVPTDSGLFNQFRELHLTVKPDGSMTEN